MIKIKEIIKFVLAIATLLITTVILEHIYGPFPHGIGLTYYVVGCALMASSKLIDDLWK